MANSNFIVHNGLQVGPLTIDAATGSISTTGTVSVGGVAVSAISQNDSSITINDTGTNSNISFVIDGSTEHVMTANLTTLNGNLKVNDVGYIQVPAGTNAQRPGSASNGMMRYNSDITSFEGYYAGAWSSLGGVKSVDGKAYIQAETSAGAGDDVIRVYAGDSGTSTQVMWASTSNVKVIPSTVSSSTTTGALQVAGGAGIAGALYAGTVYTTGGSITGGTGQFSTLTATNFSTANAQLTGGSITGGTGQFSTLTATNLSSGNAQVTISTASQPSITTLAGVTSFGTSGVVTTAAGSLTVTGNLVVNGTTTTINATTLDVADLNITVAKGAATAAAANGAGLTVDTAAATLLYTSATDSWNFNKQVIGQFTTSNLQATGGSVTGVNGSATTFIATNFTSGNAQIGGGSIAGAHSGTAAFTTATTTNFSTGNAQLTGGAITSMTGQFSTLTATNLSSGNLQATGGSVSGASITTSNGGFTTLQATNFSSGNAQITGGAITGMTGAFSTLTATNLSSGNLRVTGDITPNANATVNIGSATAWFNNIYGISTQAKYADLAENYQADKAYIAGQVLEFGGDNEVTLATADTKRVAGVVSSNPAHLMNGGLSGVNVVPLALQGRVPCNVIGPVAKGDLMVSAGFGYAKANNDAVVGQVIGKALADYSGAKGQIEVVVGRF